MTHFNRTGPMQLAIAPLLNDRELLTAVYLDNYLTDPDENKYRDMLDMVRETGISYYDNNQVEGGSADGAYAKNIQTRKYYQESLGINNDWIQLKWDYAHQINCAEDDVRKDSEVSNHLTLARDVVKCCRYGKEYVAVFGQPDVRCVSLTDNIVHEVLQEESVNFQVTLFYIIWSCKSIDLWSH